MCRGTRHIINVTLNEILPQYFYDVAPVNTGCDSHKADNGWSDVVGPLSVSNWVFCSTDCTQNLAVDGIFVLSTLYSNPSIIRVPLSVHTFEATAFIDKSRGRFKTTFTQSCVSCGFHVEEFENQLYNTAGVQETAFVKVSHKFYKVFVFFTGNEDLKSDCCI